MTKQGAKTVMPRLRFPEFRGAPSWIEKTLGDEGEFLSPLTGKTAQHFGTGNAKYVTYMNVFANTFTDMATLGVVDVTEGESQNSIEPGDVLFTVSSETPEEVGMSSVVVDAAPNCYVNSFCAMFRFSGGKQPNLRFLGYALRQPFARRHFVKRAQGSTRFNLSKPAFRSLPLALPIAAEQQKIADCLTSLDEVIAAQGRKVESLKAHKRGLMQQLFPREGETRPRLRFPEFRDAPEWGFSLLRDLEEKKMVELGRGNVISHDDMRANPGSNPVYSSSVINQGLMGTYGAYMFDEELISWSVDGGGHFFHRPKHKFSVTNVSGFMRVLSDQIVCRFLAYQLQNLHAAHTFDYQQKAHPSVIRALYNVGIPCSKEQQRIADCLASLDTRISAEADYLAALKTHKHGLMQQLFPVLDKVTA